jgi:hypothetical protein
MGLKLGAWAMNESGEQIELGIASVDPQTGVVTGAVQNLGTLIGLWDETSRTVTFCCPAQLPFGAGPSRLYKGFLFSTPRSPTPGQDVVWTLSGFVQVINLNDLTALGGNARRNTFGWYAQITEVA